jgi:hypothetical protein
VVSTEKKVNTAADITIRGVILRYIEAISSRIDIANPLVDHLMQKLHEPSFSLI